MNVAVEVWKQDGEASGGFRGNPDTGSWGFALGDAEIYVICIFLVGYREISTRVVACWV